MDNKRIMRPEFRKLLGELERARNVCRKKKDPIGEEAYDFTIRYLRRIEPYTKDVEEFKFYSTFELDDYIVHESKRRDIYNVYWPVRCDIRDLIERFAERKEV